MLQPAARLSPTPKTPVHTPSASTAACAHALVQGVAIWHAAAAAELRRRRTEAARKRVEALKTGDMASYLACVSDAKNARVQEMLKQTDECLR